MDHDQRFKTLLRHFFAEFLQLFFTEWAARFDLAHVEWLDKELLPQPPDGPVHVLDLVARVGAKEPVQGQREKEPWLVLVHIEIESPDQTTRIKPRLPHYYYHLRSTYGLPVLPIVVFLNVQLDGIGVDVQTEQFWELEVVTFRYLYVGLPGLDGVEYVQGDSWLGVALAALMRVPKDRVAWLGAEALRRLTVAPLSPHERFLLGECVQAYLSVDEQQIQDFENILLDETYAEGRKMNKTLFEHAMEKGRLTERREMTLAILEERFGPVPMKLREHVESLDADALRQLALRVTKANSLDDVGLASYAR
jgi:hypothetical protein